MIWLILASFGTYFVAHSIALEDGPFGICAWVRNKFDPTGEQATWYARGINCPRCIGFWVAFVFALILAHQDPTIHRSEFVLYWLGIAGASSAIYGGVG